MTREAVVRSLGSVLAAGMLAWILLGPDLGSGWSELVSFVAGILLGGGVSLLVTGRLPVQADGRWAFGTDPGRDR